MRNGWHIEFGNKYLYKNNKVICAEYNNGDICWYNESGWYHRLDGPAIIYSNGNKEWYLNGNIFRVRSQKSFENTPEVKELIRLEKLRAFE